MAYDKFLASLSQGVLHWVLSSFLSYLAKRQVFFHKTCNLVYTGFFLGIYQRKLVNGAQRVCDWAESTNTACMANPASFCSAKTGFSLAHL